MCGISAHTSRWHPVCLRVLSALAWTPCPGPWGAEGPGGARAGGASCGCRPACSCPGPVSALPFLPPCQCPDCCEPLRREGLLVRGSVAWPCPRGCGRSGWPWSARERQTPGWSGVVGSGGLGGWSFPRGHQAPGAARDPSLTLLLLCGIPLSPGRTWACSHAHTAVLRSRGVRPGEEGQGGGVGRGIARQSGLGDPGQA